MSLLQCFSCKYFSNMSRWYKRAKVICIRMPQCQWAGQNCSINQWKSPAGGAVFKRYWDPSKHNHFWSLDKRGEGNKTKLNHFVWLNTPKLLHYHAASVLQCIWIVAIIYIIYKFRNVSVPPVWSACIQCMHASISPSSAKAELKVHVFLNVGPQRVEWLNECWPIFL